MEEVAPAEAPEVEERRTRVPERSYFIRHWKGELTLGLSYWINGFFFTILAVMAGAVIENTVDITQSPRLFSAGFAVWAIFLGVLAIWQMVGIWHSAGRTIKERKVLGKGAPWATLARIATGLGFLSLMTKLLTQTLPNAGAYLQIAFSGDDTPHHILKVLNGGSEIELAGGIDFSTAADFRTLLEATVGVRTIDLDNIGGRVGKAEHVRDLIREHHLATYTNASCVSACTVVYMGGYPRYLGPQGKLGFHRYTFPGLSPEQDAAFNQQGEKDLVAAGVTPDFAAKAFSTSSSDLWIPDRATLLSAHVATQVVDGSAFAVAAVGGPQVTRDDIDKTLSSFASFLHLSELIQPHILNRLRPS